MLCDVIYFAMKQASLLKVTNSREYFSHLSVIQLIVLGADEVNFNILAIRARKIQHTKREQSRFIPLLSIVPRVWKHRKRNTFRRT